MHLKPMQRMKILSGAMALGMAAAAMAQDVDLQKVLSQMDASSAKFQDVQADIDVDNFTAVVSDHAKQRGTTAFRRVNGSMEMLTVLDKGQQGEIDLLYKSGQLYYYQPGLKHETIFAAAANKAEWDSLLATGFGATGKDLAAAWTVTVKGTENIGGVSTVELDLVSKQQSIRNNFSHVTLWVDPARDISLKQVMVQPDGDSRTVTYSNIRYNAHPDPGMFNLKPASGTQIERR
jgi:outer membrane lipoprotein-sorting protein